MAEKKLIICDTDVLIDYWHSTSDRHEVAKQRIEDEIKLDNIVISAITKMELFMGAANKTELNKISKQLQRFHIALINDEITKLAMALFEQYRLSHGMSIPDCFIASTVLVTDLELFTFNIKDYRFIKELNLFDGK